MSRIVVRPARPLAVLSFLVLAASPAFAQSAPSALEAGLRYRSGRVTVGHGLAEIAVPEGLRFLDAGDSRRLLLEGWDATSLPGAEVLGMLVPAGLSPLADDGWAVLVTFDARGHVGDSNAGTFDVARLLRDVQARARASNVDRRAAGADSVNVVGWATPPRFDAATHSLSWAQELAFGSRPRHVLTADVRILGRRGVLGLTAVALMSQLDDVRARLDALVPAIAFAEGQRYDDYRVGQDDVSSVTVAALVTASPAGAETAPSRLPLLASTTLAVGVAAVMMALGRGRGRR